MASCQMALLLLIINSECLEALSLNTNSQSKYPYAMEFLISMLPSIHSTTFGFCFGTLISKSFVLTNAYCLASAKFEGFKIRKLKLPDEQYSNNQVFTVKRLIKHGLYKGVYLEVGLLELNEAISFQGDESIFRPACLWSNLYSRSDTQYLFEYGSYESERVIITPATLMLTCATGNSRNIICVNSTGEPMEGSPIVDGTNRHIIIGIYLFRGDGSISTTAKITDVIDWIELHVWPEGKIVNPGEHECGRRKIKLKPHTTYAYPTYHGEFPWHVALYQMKGRDNHKYVCGGSIITDRFILTAAHCLYNEYGMVIGHNRLFVVAGTYDLNEYHIDARYYGVGVVIVHERYNPEYLEHDIALLKLNVVIEYSNYIQPICVGNSSKFSQMERGLVAGWGLNEFGLPTNSLLQATFPIHDSFYCRASNRDFYPQFLNENNFCGGHENGTNTCSGDSGSGMIHNNNSQWFIRGIVSFGKQLPNSSGCDITELSVFTDVTKYYEWIMNKLGNSSVLIN